jgi:hypothetical protein
MPFVRNASAKRTPASIVELVSGVRSEKLNITELTIDEPSRLSSEGSSMLKAADTSKAYRETSCRPIWGLTTDS